MSPKPPSYPPSYPPSFPPARVTPRPVVEEPDGPRRPPRASRLPGQGDGSVSRRRSIAWGAVSLAAILVAFHASGLAPWARAITEASALDPKLERAIGRAIAAAAEEGVELRVTSGLRSAEEQRALWHDAVAEHGGQEEAARWVLPPELSAHVQGLAVDVGPLAGALWLAEHGSRWGLCQVFANEPWHFERLTGKNGTCPGQLPDPSHLLTEK